MNFDEFYLRADTFKKEVDCLKVLKESFIIDSSYFEVLFDAYNAPH